jgi:glycine/D-amino acid oxidase-like deaminating enzyme
MPDEVPVVFYPDEGWVQGRHLVGRLVGQAVAAGAERRFGVEVREIGEGDVRAVVLSDGSRVDVDVVVNAAGPNAFRVAGLVGRRLPMLREPGVIARVGCGSVPIRRVMHAPRIAMRPDGDTSMLLHSIEIDALIDKGGDEPEELARLLRESARHVLPGLDDSRVLGARVVDRPIPEDGFPSVGAVPSVPGYYEAVSHSGVTLAAVIGRLLASEIVTGTRDELLADFRPERFAS